MARYRDQSPCGNSCPHIDSAIDVLENSRNFYNNSEVDYAIKELEKARSIAEELREWGNELYRELEAQND